MNKTSHPQKEQKKHIVLLILIAAIPLLVVALFTWTNEKTKVISVQNGVAEASEYTPSDGPFTLTGEWLRFQGSYTPAELEDLAGEEVRDIRFIRKMRGYTYSFTLTLSESADWYFLMNRPHSSRLWLNGEEVTAEGGNLSSGDIYRFRDYTQESEIHVVLQVSMSSIYDVYQGILIGSRTNLSMIQTRWMVLDISAIGMSVMLIFICMGLFFPKRSETYLLLLALSTLAELAHFLLIPRHPSLSFFHLGTPSFYRQLGFINFYVCQQFVPGESRKWMNRSVPAVILLTALACAIWPEYSNTWIRYSYLYYMALQAWILGKGVLRRITEAPIILTGCMLALGNELFYLLLYAGRIPQGQIDIEIMPAQFARFAYIVAFGLATCTKYGKKFQEAEHLSADLEQKVQEQTEELRQTNERLVQTQKNRQRFLMDMVHNLRSPLFAMGGYLDLLRDATENPTPEQEKYMDMLDRKTEFIGKMTDDMFLIYRLEDGQLQLERENFDLIQLLEHVKQDALAKGQEKGLRITLQCAESQIFVLGDRFRLKQALDNILDNAVRYSPDGGEIRISQRQEERQCWITISDQGPGISKEQQERLFVRYKSKGEDGKTGLGLSISRYIVQLHGGSIQVDSIEGAGTTMIVSLPWEEGSSGEI